jgi:hypothetical protein
LPRELLREGDTVWLYAPDGSLRIQPVEVVWRESKRVFVRSGLSGGDVVIASDLPSPVESMALATTASPSRPIVQAAEPGAAQEVTRSD